LEGANKTVGRIDTDVTPDLKATLDELRRVLATADGMIKNELNTALAEARRVLATADGTLNNQLNSALEELRRATATADRVLNDADGTLLGRNAPIQAELRDALQEVARAARSLRGLTDYLERHPESLIRGKD
jgi:paraquat-inducible protein B